MTFPVRPGSFRRRRVHVVWACAAWVGCAQATGLQGCLEPPITDTAEAQGVISGTVVYQGPVPAPVEGRPAAGNVLLFVYAEAAPPPPAGAGRPVTFSVVPRQALFGSTASGQGFHSAAFTIPLVPPGRYLMRALLDVDGDFEPFALVRSSASRGDVGGGAVDTTVNPPRFEVLEVRGGQQLRGVTVTLSAAAAGFPADAPAVTLPQDATFPRATTLPVRFRLDALAANTAEDAVTSQDLPGNGTPGLVVEFGDVDGDGVADDSDGDGFADVFPRVLLRRIANGSADGLEDDPALTTIPCVVDPTSLLGAWPPPERIAAQGLWVRALDVLCLPVAVDARQSPAAPLPQVPAGRYAVLLVSRLGQVWRVPNEFGPAADPVAIRLLDAALPSQGAWVTVTEDATPGGALEGLVRLDVQPTGTTYVLVYRPDALPPPAGTGAPVASARLAPELFQPDENGFSASYRVGGLPPGDYVLAGVVDMDRNFDPRVERFSQATQGDWVAAPGAPVTVEDGPAEAEVHLDTPVPTDPPVFTVAQGARVTLTGRLAATLLGAPTQSAIATTGRGGGFLAGWRSSQAAPVDADGDGLPDLWPRAVLARVRADAADTSGVGPERRVVLAAAVDPIPLGMALGNTLGALVASSTLSLSVLPSAVDATDPSAPLPLPRVPAGTYALTLLDRTGQFARPLPLQEALAAVGYVMADGSVTPATYASDGWLVDVPAVDPPSGGLEGSVVLLGVGVPTGPVWVLVFDDENPGPPDGAGLPLAVTRVFPAAFADMGGNAVASYSVGGLPPGTYRVQALLDSDANFSLLTELRSAATAGDRVGAHVAGMPARPSTVDVATEVVTGVNVVVAVEVPVGPPAFEVLTPPGVLDAPRGMTLRALAGGEPAVSPGGPVDLQSSERAFAVTLRDANGDGVPDDADADGIPDVYPRVVLSPVDGSARRIPGAPDPSRYLPALLSGTPAVITDTLSVQVWPVAVDAQSQRVPLLGGAHAVAVLTAAGQAWRVPNALAPANAQAGGGVASQGQGVDLAVGAAAGTRTLSGDLVVPMGVEVCAPVVVLARSAAVNALSALERPAALTVVQPTRGAGGACQQTAQRWSLSGLRPGTYLVSAFADVDGDFHPFVGTRAGFSAGDVGGAHLDAAGAALEPVTVADVDLADVTVTLGRVAPLEKPAFRVDTGWPTGGSLLGGPLRTALVTLAGSGGLSTPLAQVDAMTNLFTTLVVNQGAGSVTWPLVLLVRLDEADPRGLTLRSPLEVVAGDVDETQFTAPAGTRLEVVFSPVRVDATLRAVAPANAGRYALVVINQDGSRWQVPNELSPSLSATGTGLPGSAGQGTVWTWQ